MQFFLDTHRDSIINDLKKIIECYKIDYIILLAKKGVFLFKKIIDKNYISVISNDTKRIIPIYSDRVINKKNDFSFLNNKRILLFDDTMKSGKHFSYTKNYLINKIEKSLSENDKCDCQFYFYCIARCQGKSQFMDFLDEEIVSYFKDALSFDEYHKFSIKEAYYFQKELQGNSIDLPVFEMKVNDIELFKNILSEEKEFFSFHDYKCYIGNDSINLGVLVFDRKLPIFDIFDGLIIAAICKIRYERINDNEYKVVIRSFILCDNIEYDELVDVYNRLIQNSKKEVEYGHIQLHFVQYFRYINFFLDFYMANELKYYLDAYDYDLEYTHNGEKQFSYSFDSYVFNTITDYTYNIEEKMYGFQHYSENNDVFDNSEYSLNEISRIIFDILNKEKSTITKQDDFININRFENLYKNKNNYIYFCDDLIRKQETFSISTEIELRERENNKTFVEVGFIPGEISITNLPYDARLFFRGIYLYYNKVNKDFNIYKKNYELFINKFYGLLESENFFFTNLITNESFAYLKNYFNGLTTDNIDEEILSKNYLLDDKETLHEQLLIEKKINIILQSSDFIFTN